MLDNYDLSSILQSKQAYRKELSKKSFADKLLIVESMRARELTISKARNELSKKKNT